MAILLAARLATRGPSLFRCAIRRASAGRVLATAPFLASGIFGAVVGAGFRLVFSHAARRARAIPRTPDLAQIAAQTPRLLCTSTIWACSHRRGRVPTDEGVLPPTRACSSWRRRPTARSSTFQEQVVDRLGQVGARVEP